MNNNGRISDTQKLISYLKTEITSQQYFKEIGVHIWKLSNSDRTSKSVSACLLFVVRLRQFLNVRYDNHEIVVNESASVIHVRL